MTMTNTARFDQQAQTSPTKLNHWINGRSTVPAGQEYADSFSPATGQVVAVVGRGTSQDVDDAATSAASAAEAWRRVPAARRGRILMAIAESIRSNSEMLTAMEVADTGKIPAAATAEVEGAAAYFEFYAGLVNLPLGDVLDVEPDQHVYTRREPYGVVGVITPWNVPINQAARAAAPALAAGNVVVMKPAETSSQTTVALARLASEAGLPAGVMNVVVGLGPTVGTAIVEHPLVRKVAFTGSVAIGKAIGKIAAERIIPLTLELGGKSANIVFEDADLDKAASEAVRAFTANAGQVCSAGTRLLVQKPVYDQFLEAVSRSAANVVPGRDIGPMITKGQYEQVRNYFEIAQNEGAVAVLGATLPATPELSAGLYVNPTIYSGVDNSMRIAREEVFGPVLVVIPFDDEEDAVRIANDSDFGLVGAVWTKDISRAFRVADAVQAGQIFINTWSTGSVQTPFGGLRNSGYGREKGIEAMHHYSQLKTVVVAL